MILFLGPDDSPIFHHLREVEPLVVHRDGDIEVELNPSFVVSHGYRKILKQETLLRLACPVLNVHISLLPWNRGADPNFWSHLESTPKGVTVHEIDAGIDTGPVYAQREVAFGPDATLRSSYAVLQEAATALFVEVWPEIRAGRMRPQPQSTGGTFHRAKDKTALAHLLSNGWETPIAALEQAAGEYQLSRSVSRDRSSSE